jgi:ATP-dependent Clp protease ATP-binding subunit ClpA
MYENFSDRAQKVLSLANQQAQRFNHGYIGTEHVLLGLVEEGAGVGATVLKNLGVDQRKVRLEVKKLIKIGADIVPMGKRPNSPRVKKVIECAIEESRNLNHNYVGTEHLLLGLLREHDGIAAQVLMNLGLKLEEVREEVLHLLGVGVEPAGRQVRTTSLPALERLQSELTPRVKKVIEYAIEESRALNHNYVGTEHLLLGLLREHDGVAAQVLMNLGLNLQEVREEVLNLLGR